MQVKRTLMDTFRETLHCDCGGVMVWKGFVTTTKENKITYPHGCEDCGYFVETDTEYPAITHVPAALNTDTGTP